MKSCAIARLAWIMALLWGPAAVQLHAAENPAELLKEADRARGGVEGGASWQVKLNSSEDGETSSTTYSVRAKGNNAYVEVIEPARSKGEIILFNDRTIWFFKPSMRKPVALSARQKLSGQAANGDIASTNYARDYEGTIVGEEKVGADDCYVLELKAKSDSATYDRIKYWISKANKLGLKSEFMSVQGKTLKIATMQYGNSIRVHDKTYSFVSSFKIIDARNKDNSSEMIYTDVKVDSPADSLFNVNNLQR